MEYHFKSIAGVIAVITIAEMAVEADFKSPAKIEEHTEVETVLYPQPSFGTAIVASTTISGDSIVLGQYMPFRRYA